MTLSTSPLPLPELTETKNVLSLQTLTSKSSIAFPYFIVSLRSVYFKEQILITYLQYLVNLQGKLVNTVQNHRSTSRPQIDHCFETPFEQFNDPQKRFLLDCVSVGDFLSRISIAHINNGRSYTILPSELLVTLLEKTSLTLSHVSSMLSSSYVHQPLPDSSL